MQKKKIYIIGNCISKSVLDSLLSSTFVQKFFDVHSPKKYIHEYSIKSNKDEALQIKNEIESADILIYMPIKNSEFVGINGEEMKELMKAKGGSSIRIPVPFFQAYWPESSFVRPREQGLKINGMLKDFPSVGRDKVIHYFEMTLFYQWVLKKDISTYGDYFFSEGFFEKKFIENLAVESINALKQREVADLVDIPISDFINENYRQKKLFYTINHPSEYLLGYLVREILLRLGASIDEANDFTVNPKWVRFQDYPIYKSVVNGLDISFPFEDNYYIDFSRVSRSDFAIAHTKFFESKANILNFDSVIPSSVSTSRYIDSALKEQFTLK